ncbi:hypothetical protein IM774_02300 [Erysipelotrichaceae bacterium RD49]|nr:hypothetical protein [Erysipelotrichaceae bacterium RD49]
MSKDFDFFETSAIFSKSDSVSYNEDALLVRLISHKDVFADVFHLLKDFPLDVDPKKLTFIGAGKSSDESDAVLHGLESEVIMQQVDQNDVGDWIPFRLRIENLMSIDPAISLRVTEHNVLELAEMVRERRLGAVATIILYFGMDQPWPSVKSAYELIDEQGSDPRIKAYVQDLRAVVIDLGALKDKQIAGLESDLHDLAIMMCCCRNGQDVPALNHPLKYPQDTIRLAATLFGSKHLADAILADLNEEEPITLEPLKQALIERDQHYFYALGQARSQKEELVSVVLGYFKEHPDQLNRLFETYDLDPNLQDLLRAQFDL